MSKQVPWNKLIVETFITEAMLSEDEEMILRTRVAGWSRVQQSEKLGMSLSTVDRIIKTLKEKYDNVQKYYVMLPPRKTSTKEKWLDEN